MNVKVCCISSVEEARLALAAGANVLGLVGPMPTGPGILSHEAIATIVQAIPATATTWLLTSETTAKAIIQQHKLTKTTGIQLVTKLERGAHAQIRAALPDVQLTQVIHVIDETSIEEAKQFAPLVDYILLDSGNPEKQELGGTGRVHNWTISRAIVATLDKPVFLAGGLKSENVRDAIEQVQPYGLDLCSGIRMDKKLDKQKLQAFMQTVHKGIRTKL